VGGCLAEAVPSAAEGRTDAAAEEQARQRPRISRQINRGNTCAASNTAAAGEELHRVASEGPCCCWRC